MRLYEIVNANLPLLIAFMVSGLVFGIIGFAVGRTTAKRGPTRTIEVYEGPEAPF